MYIIALVNNIIHSRVDEKGKVLLKPLDYSSNQE